jgi:nucleotide-binding universal stress UspA family protein
MEDHLRLDHAPDVADDVPATEPTRAGSCGIVVPVDLFRPPTRAVLVAAVVARQAGLGIEIITAPPYGLPRADLSARVGEARAAGAPSVRDEVLGTTSDPAAAITEHVRCSGATLLCMATRGRTPHREVLGSVSAAVVRSSPVPVLLVGPTVDRFGPHVERIVAGVDGSELSEAAVPAAARLAASLSADLVLVRVAPDGATKEDDVAYVEYLNGVASHYPRQPVQVDLLHDDDPARGIARYAGGTGETVAALATHGRGALGRLVLGSIARTVARRASCPVLVVPSRG